MDKFLKFLNSSLGLVLVGALVGAIGLFTWQRMDWIFKQEYLRQQVIIDRKIAIIENINIDIGSFIANADGVIAVIAKRVPIEQRNQTINIYNDEQAKWFSTIPSHSAQLRLYFPEHISDEFSRNIVPATEDVDREISKYSRAATQEQLNKAYDASRKVRSELQAWNNLAMRNLLSK